MPAQGGPLVPREPTKPPTPSIGRVHGQPLRWRGLGRSREQSTHAPELSSVFNADALTEYGIWSHPSIYETSIVANLVSIALYGLYNVQIVVAADSTQHDVADGERRSVYWLNCAKLARFDSAPHRDPLCLRHGAVPKWPK
jgi:hypothetical protein